MGKRGNNATFGKKGEFADKIHNQLTLNTLNILPSYCVRYLLYHFRCLLYTFVKVYSTFVIYCSALSRRTQRTLFDGLIVPHGKTIKERAYWSFWVVKSLKKRMNTYICVIYY